MSEINATGRASGHKLHFIVPCMGRLEMVRRTIEAAMAQLNTTYTFVDYCCPDRSGAWVRERYPQANVIAVTGGARWHASAARNIGAREAPDGWLCFLDSDVVLNPGFSRAVLEMARTGTFLAPVPKPGICGMIVCAKSDFERCGGYDENIHGWGWEDIELRLALDRAGVAYRELPESLVAHVDHDDRLRSEHCAIVDPEVSNAINMRYSLIKEYLLRNDPGCDAAALRALYRCCTDRTLLGNAWPGWPDPARPVPTPDPTIKFVDLPCKAYAPIYRTLAEIARGYVAMTEEGQGDLRAIRIDREEGAVLELFATGEARAVRLRIDGAREVTVMSLFGEMMAVPATDGVVELTVTDQSIFVFVESGRDIVLM